MAYCVYKHTCPNGKVYIGITKQTPEKRWKNGFGYKSSPHFWSAIKLYGWQSIEHEILYTGLSKEDACSIEKSLIEKYRSNDREYGYNEKTGGETGVCFNDSVKRAISEKGKIRFLDPEKRKYMSDINKGRKLTAEQRQKISIAKLGKHFKMTDSWKKNIGLANKRAYAVGTEARMKVARHCVENGKKQSKPVEQCDMDWNVISTYDSFHDAERTTGVRNGNISKCCNGFARTAGGFKWRFAS